MPAWTILSLIRWTAEYLSGRAFSEARLDAELLLAGVLGVKRLDLYLQYDRPLDPDELAEFKTRLRRRLRHEPLQYIEGVAYFRGLVLRVDRRVLIPRPETEVLVGEVLRWAAGREGLDVADIGTGSGAIALSLRQEGAFRRVVATDVSSEALRLAAENRGQGGAPLEVELRLGPGCEPLRGDVFDVIVSNPPYVGDREADLLPPEVRDWEPGTALFAGDDGLDVIRSIIAEAPDRLRPGGLLALEIGAGQAARVAALVSNSPSFGEPIVRQDLTGRDRFVLTESMAEIPAAR